jgi:cobaltochelatase CobN
MIRFTLVSTKTTLKTLFEAVENVEKETGVKIDLDVIYAHTHDLDKLDPIKVVSRVSEADVLLVDLRSTIPGYLEEAIASSRAKVVVPLVGGDDLAHLP